MSEKLTSGTYTCSKGAGEFNVTDLETSVLGATVGLNNRVAVFLDMCPRDEECQQNCSVRKLYSAIQENLHGRH